MQQKNCRVFISNGLEKMYQDDNNEHIFTTFSNVSTVEFEQVDVCWGYSLFQYRHVLRNNRKH